MMNITPQTKQIQTMYT